MFMKLDLSNTYEVNKAIDYLEKLINNKSKIELKAIKPKRTIKQNSYLHVIITLYAIEFGWSLDEAKTHLKRTCEFMRYKKNNETFLKRTRDLDTRGLTEFIDWIRNYSSKQGCYLPTADEYKTQSFEIDKHIDANSKYF